MRRLVRWLLLRLILAVLLVFIVLPGALMWLYLHVPPPVTPLMLIRSYDGYGIEKDWRDLEQMSADLPASVIAAEDNRFCRHQGFDLDAIWLQWERYKAGKTARGASGLSQQTAKNLFLWPDRGWFGKILETYLTVALEQFWPKRRILEVYLNIAELAPGTYGMQAGAHHHFGRTAANVTRRQSALLASILPAPLHWSAAEPNKRVARKARIVERRAREIQKLLDCY